jgi:hypothetical protein
MHEIFAQKKYGWHKKMGMRKLKKMLGLAVFFFFFVPTTFRILATKKIPNANGRKVFFLVPKKCKNRHILKKKKSQVAIFWKKKIQKSPYLDNQFLFVARTKQESFFKLYFIVRSIAKFGSFLWWMIAKSKKEGKDKTNYEV